MLNGKQGLRIFILLSPQVTLSSGVQKQLHHSVACATEKLGAAAGPPEEVMLGGGGGGEEVSMKQVQRYAMECSRC